MRKRERIWWGREREKDGAVWRELCVQDLIEAVTFCRETQPAPSNSSVKKIGETYCSTFFRSPVG